MLPVKMHDKEQNLFVRKDTKEVTKTRGPERSLKFSYPASFPGFWREQKKKTLATFFATILEMYICVVLERKCRFKRHFGSLTTVWRISCLWYESEVELQTEKETETFSLMRCVISTILGIRHIQHTRETMFVSEHLFVQTMRGPRLKRPKVLKVFSSQKCI